MTNTGPGGLSGQASGAAASRPAGPTIAPRSGPTTRRDVVIALIAIAAVAGGILALALS